MENPQSSGWRQAWQNLLAPPSCLACAALLAAESKLQFCDECQTRICRSGLPRTCNGCAARLPGPAGSVSSCHFCRDVKMPFASVLAIANYEDLLRDLVVHMKSRHGQALAIQLGHWLGWELTRRRDRDDPTRLDFVVPMPSHWIRRLRRGFNVCDLLVESICRYPDFRGKARRLLAANRTTRKQGTLTISQRFDNVKNCFVISGKPDIEGASILLVDDVMTSGATAIQAANTLLRAGADRIHLAIVARGVGRQA